MRLRARRSVPCGAGVEVGGGEGSAGLCEGFEEVDIRLEAVEVALEVG